VGLASIDLCRHAGAEMWGSAGTGKHAFIRERGCQHLLDSRADAWPEPKMDLVLDARGGESWARGLDALRAGGRLVCFGMSSGSTGEAPSRWAYLKAAMSIPWLATNPVALINANKGVLGVNMGRLWDEGERARGWLDRVLDLWAQGVVRPHIHAQVPFAEVAEAHRILHRRENVGKVVLVP
jgi:NADPH:quinone reductase-like Zn-dependent oxidoreductase